MSSTLCMRSAILGLGQAVNSDYFTKFCTFNHQYNSNNNIRLSTKRRMTRRLTTVSDEIINQNACCCLLLTSL